MVEPSTVNLILALSALVGALTTIPFGLTAIAYRQRDNGLAFLLLVSGVGIWNLMFVGQYLSPEPIIEAFFLALSVVGAVLSGLGWLLFATTASSTLYFLDRREFYAGVSILSGIDIVLAVMAPVHTFYWQLPTDSGGQVYTTVQPELGYWLHMGLLVVFFSVGTAHFLETWVNRVESAFSPAYTIAGSMTILAIILSNLFAPGGLGISPIVAVSLTSIGWMQASERQPLAWLQST